MTGDGASSIVVALGGNALQRRGEPLVIDTLRDNARRAAAMLLPGIKRTRTIITHGNGPQIGLLALQSENDPDVAPFPLDVLGAETEGQIGYIIERALRSRQPDLNIATLLTQVQVDPADPAFAKPSKPIGPQYTDSEARRLAQNRGWQLVKDGAGFRRVVASPRPVAILGIDVIRCLSEFGHTVICAGGGGIPVAVTDDGVIVGVEAVIDKDLTTALLAEHLQADRLILLTDVEAVYRDWPGTMDRPLGQTTPSQLRAMAFEPGTMGPKVDAACGFVEGTKRSAAIGALDQAAAVIIGEAGTQIVPD